MIEINKTYQGDALAVLKTFPDNCIDCCVTSPPYFGLRDYGVIGQIGLEKTPDEFVSRLVEVFSEVKRVMKPTATLWLNLGDSYAGSGKGMPPENGLNKCHHEMYGKILPFHNKYTKPKDLIGIPWLVAFALRNSGWYLRQDIIWHKPNPMPESVTDRCTKAHEYIFLLSKSSKYYYDAEAIKTDLKNEASLSTPGGWAVGPGSHDAKDHATEEGRSRKVKNIEEKKYGINGAGFQGHSGNFGKDGKLLGSGKANKRSVWTINPQPFPEAHFATFPPELIVDCIKAGCPVDGIVLDPFNGSGTTRIVAEKLGRNSIGIELNPKYIQIENRRRKKELGMFEKVAS